MGEGNRRVKEMKKEEKRKIGQRKQASTINVKGGKIQNNKVGGHNSNKTVGSEAVESGSHAVCRHKMERKYSRWTLIYKRKF